MMVLLLRGFALPFKFPQGPGPKPGRPLRAAKQQQANRQRWRKKRRGSAVGGSVHQIVSNADLRVWQPHVNFVSIICDT